MRPRLLTFDMFGTVVDWRRGMIEALSWHGAPMRASDFDRVIDRQAALQSGPFRSYESILATSLIEVLGTDARAARAIAATAGSWPLFEDSRSGLQRLMRYAPCVATTNSDERHGKEVQRSLGYRLSGWVSAESVRVYKPDPAFWTHAAARRHEPFGRSWWHVSAYADYDLDVARRIGLTTVYVDRPHARPGRADYSVRDLQELARLIERTGA